MMQGARGLIPGQGTRGAYPVAQTVKNLPVVQETWVRSLGQKDPLEKGMSSDYLFLPGEFHGQSPWRKLTGCSSRDHKELDATE